MPHLSRLHCCISALLLLGSALSCAQSSSNESSRNKLHEDYRAAQLAQQSSDSVAAITAYQRFLSEAQIELAQAYLLAGDTTRSGALLENALALSPESGELLQIARTSLLAGQLERAKKCANAILSGAPASQKPLLAEAHQVLGRVWLKENHENDARREFEMATALDPTFQNGYNLAVTCLDLGDETCAVQLFKEMQSSFGDKPELHIAFGRAYGNSDFQSRAVPEFNRALEESPNMPGAHYLLAAVMLAIGSDDNARTAAERELNAELRISPQDAPTYNALGQIALTRKNYPQAEAFLQKALQYDPHLPDAYLSLGQVYFETARPDDAATALKRCIQETTDPSRNRYQVQKAHYILGRILAQKGQHEEAHAELQLSRELADKALALDKSHLNASMEAGNSSGPIGSIADISGMQPHTPEAQAQAQALEAELKPALADGYNNLGALSAAEGEYQKAITAFRHAASWNPALDGLDYNWGRAAFAGKDYTEAVGPLKRYVAAHNNDWGARSVLAVSLFETGQYQACTEVLKSNEHVTLAPAVQLIYAQALIKTGHVNDGVQQLTSLANANPNASEIQSALAEARTLQHSAHP
jgi:tetratricopeptide (TPR) repeat protein